MRASAHVDDDDDDDDGDAIDDDDGNDNAEEEEIGKHGNHGKAANRKSVGL